jgi:hypothetical protein
VLIISPIELFDSHKNLERVEVFYKVARDSRIRKPHVTEEMGHILYQRSASNFLLCAYWCSIPLKLFLSSYCSCPCCVRWSAVAYSRLMSHERHVVLAYVTPTVSLCIIPLPEGLYMSPVEISLLLNQVSINLSFSLATFKHPMLPLRPMHYLSHTPVR